VTANLLTVAGRYLNESDLAQLEGARNQLGDWHGLNNGYSAYCTLQEKAAAVLDTLDGRSDVTDQDAKYLSGFRSQLNSAAATISRSSYNDLAEEFNEKTLSVFPASVLGTLTGVEALPIYR
jgi:hypothetical protein